MKQGYIIAIVVGLILLYFVFSKPKQENIEVDIQPEVCPDGNPIPEGACDCDGNLPDACGTCGGTVLDEQDCGSNGDLFDDNGGVTGEDGSYTWNGRTYQTKVFIDSSGNELEWMTENFANLNEDDFFLVNNFTQSQEFGGVPQCRVYGVLTGTMAQAMTKDAYATYGGLYNHAYFSPNYSGSSARFPIVDGWRLPTLEEWQNLSNSEYGIYGLLSTDNWNAGLEGDNQSMFDLRPCGYFNGYNGQSTFSTLASQGHYMTDQWDGNTGGFVKFSGGNSPMTFVTASSRMAGVRLVRVPAP